MDSLFENFAGEWIKFPTTETKLNFVVMQFIKILLETKIFFWNLSSDKMCIFIRISLKIVNNQK